jgi:uncharacterized OB-fold protein
VYTIIQWDDSKGGIAMLMKFANKKENLEIEVMKCNRCGEESDLNPLGLCSECNTQVDYEYSLLYTCKTMEY